MSFKRNTLRAALACATFATLGSAPLGAQTLPDIGFESVGRARPLAVSVQDGRENVGPDRIFEPGQPRENWTLYGFPNDAPPLEPLPRDLFNSPDFYADKDLWSDPRYFRCNSPFATEVQQGILFPPPLVADPKDGPWGFCDKDLPKEAIVSPYE